MAGRTLISRLPSSFLLLATRSAAAGRVPVVRLRPLFLLAGRFSGGASVRCFSTRPTTSSLNDPSPNWSNRPPKETILLDGCDFEHWLIVVEPPDPTLTRDEIIHSYIKKLAEVLGSEEEARMKIYSVSTKHYFAFGALVSEEISYKIKALENVRWVLPDSYLDVRNKDYGGEPFIDGQAVPYDPKYHEEWVRNNARANERSRRNDRPRNYDRSRNFERRRENMQTYQNRDVAPPMPGSSNNPPPSPTAPPMPGGPQNAMPPPPAQNRDFNAMPPPPAQNRDFNAMPPPLAQNRDFNAMPPPPVQNRDFNAMPPSQNRDFNAMPPPAQNRDFNAMPPPPRDGPNRGYNAVPNNQGYAPPTRDQGSFYQGGGGQGYQGGPSVYQGGGGGQGYQPVGSGSGYQGGSSPGYPSGGAPGNRGGGDPGYQGGGGASGYRPEYQGGNPGYPQGPPVYQGGGGAQNYQGGGGPPPAYQGGGGGGGQNYQGPPPPAYQGRDVPARD